MEVYIFALIAFVVLLPVLFFLPGGITKKGKIGIAAGALFISLLGLLALNQYSLWMVAIILFILVMVSSLVIGNRFGPQLLAEDGVQETNSPASTEDIEKEERVLFSTVGEVLEPAENTSEETGDPIEQGIIMESENDSQVETDEEGLEEIPLLAETDIPEEEVTRQIDFEENDDLLEGEEEILEEMPNDITSEEDLSEIEWLIQQEDQDIEPVHNFENDEQVTDNDDSIEERPIIGASEESQSEMPDENDEILSEIELMIDQVEEDPEAAISDVPKVEDELETIELPNKEIESFEHEVSEDLLHLEEVTEETEHNEEAEELLIEVDSSQIAEFEIPEEEKLNSNEDLLEEKFESLETEEEKPEQEEVISDELVEEEIRQENAQDDQESETHSPLQTRVIQTIAEELIYYKNKLSLKEFEELVGQYLHPKLHDRDYFVLSQQLIQRYHESKEFTKLKIFIDEIEERFISYPILKSELNDYKEIAWKNIVKQQMMRNGRE
ncbi:hypothetical protein ACOJQI_17345 [Bacillus salacetis]|uniref:hypothetical protein n=1 Tax=Bacillus salacetis TaxID=2315464 RepID=UPI003BA19150